MLCLKALFFGLLFSLGFQPAGFIFVAIIGFVYFYRTLVMSPFASHRTAFLLGWLFGLGYFTGGLYWIACALHIDWVKFGWLVPFAAVGIPSVLAITIGFAAYVSSKLRRYSEITALLGFVLIWSLAEWGRGHLLTGFPWLNVSEIWLGGELIIQNLAVFGTYGLGFITLLMFALLYLIINETKKLRYISFGLFLIVASGLVFYGGTRLYNLGYEKHENFDLVIVQPSILQIHKWDPDYINSNIKKMVKLTEEAYARSSLEGSDKPKVVIWPEAAIPYLTAPDTDFMQYITSTLGANDVLILGAIKYVYDEDGHLDKLYNSMYVLDHNANIVGSYDKSHLVPFGEYVPLRSFLPDGISKITAGARDFSAGSGLKAIKIRKDIPAFSPLICYEAIFPGDVLPKENNKVEWLLNLTNDGWYLNSSGPYQHLAITRMRAIEEGMPLVRVVYRGISAVFDPYGRVVAKIPFGVSDAITTSLPKSLQNKTIYSMYIDSVYFAMILFCVLIVLSLLGYYKRR